MIEATYTFSDEGMEKMLGHIKKLEKALKEIANGHLGEKISESIAKDALK